MRARKTPPAALAAALAAMGLAWSGCGRIAGPSPVADPSAYVDPLIGTANGGNTFPGAVRARSGWCSGAPRRPAATTRARPRRAATSTTPRASAASA